MRIQVLGIVALITVVSQPSWSQTQSDFELPEPIQTGQTLRLWSTHYFVHTAVSVPTGVQFKDKNNKPLSDPISPRDWCLAAIEGTVRVSLNGAVRTLNYGGVGTQSQVDCASVLKIDPKKKKWISSTGKSYFNSAVGLFGDGVAGYKLVPYRTIAVDKSTIPYGTVIYIPSARGIVIPQLQGQPIKHDGYFFAGDTGGAIKGDQIDLFCGASASNCLPGVVTSDSTKSFQSVIVKDETVINALRALHK